MASGTHKEEEYFPVKLFRMVEDEDFSEIIWWNEVCRIRNLNLLSLKFFFCDCRFRRCRFVAMNVSTFFQDLLQAMYQMYLP